MDLCAKEIDEKILKSTVILVDIEGTTTSICFVKDVLFPFAAAKAGEFLAANWEIAAVQEAVEGMRAQAAKDIADKVEGAVAIPDKEAEKDAQISALASSVQWLVSTDSKAQHFKKLSGLIWEGGYKAGDLKGHLYKDVQPALESWRAAGRRIYVYSSGSVQAQQLLMTHSENGDLHHLFDGNFDTAVGLKQESQSYTNIIEKIDCKAEEALFLTDVVKEGAAAREAGLNVVLLVREGNAPLTDEDKTNYASVESFADIPLAAAALTTKRKPETTQDEDLPPAKLAKTAPETEKETEAIKPEENGVTKVDEAEKPEAMEVDAEVEAEASDVKPLEIETNETEKKPDDEGNDKTENEHSDKDQVPQAMETDSTPAKEDPEKEALPAVVAQVEKTQDVTDKAAAQVDTDIVIDKSENIVAEKTEKKVEVVAVETEDKKPNNDIADEKSDAKVEVETKVAEDDASSKPEIEKPDEEPVKEVTENIEKVEKVEEMEVTAPVEDAKKTEEKTEPEICPAKPEEDAPKENKEETVKAAESIEIDAVETPEVLPTEIPEKEIVAEKIESEPAKNGLSESAEEPPAEEIENKLDDLLGEEGAALEKECAEILSKVDKDISSSETLIQKTIGDGNTVADDPMEVAETAAEPVAVPADIQPDKAEIQMEESDDPTPPAKEPINSVPLDKIESVEATPEIESTDKTEVKESIPEVETPVSETSKDESPPVVIEEKAVQIETEPEAPEPKTETADEKNTVPTVTEETTSKSKLADSKEPLEETASIKTNGASGEETTNGNAPAAEERVNGKSCTETKDADMNGKAEKEETVEQNGDATKEIVSQEKESEERSNGAVEKKPHTRSADTAIPCEQE